MKKTLQKFLPKVVGFKLNSLFLVKPEMALFQAFYIFCRPRRGKVNLEQAVFLDPAKTETISVEGKTLQTYRWKGKKETILLVHGWESNTHRWKQLIEKLQQEGYDIVAFDAPAHGNSSGKLLNVPQYAKCVEAVVKRFSPDYLIGHSVGGMTTVFHHYKYPVKKTSKMVLLGPPSELSLIAKDFQKVLNLSPRFMKAFEGFFYEKFGFRFAEFSTAKFAENLQQPGLIVHDKYDKIAPVSASKAIHQNWENSRLVLTEGAGHSLNNALVHNEIIQFLKN